MLFVVVKHGSMRILTISNCMFLVFLYFMMMGTIVLVVVAPIVTVYPACKKMSSHQLNQNAHFALISARFRVVVIYLPPVLATRENLAISEFIIREVDNILSQNAELDVILCGDLNRFDISLLCQNLNLVNNNNKPTYGEAELDYILLSESVSDSYDVNIAAPLDVSSVPHAFLLAHPQKA